MPKFRLFGLSQLRVIFFGLGVDRFGCGKNVDAWGCGRKGFEGVADAAGLGVLRLRAARCAQDDSLFVAALSFRRDDEVLAARHAGVMGRS